MIFARKQSRKKAKRGIIKMKRIRFDSEGFIREDDLERLEDGLK